MTIESRLAEIRARAENATDGPWEDWGGVDANGVTRASGPITWDDHGGEVFKPADAEFIAHARTDVPALLAAVEAVRELHQPGHTFHGHGFSTPLCSCGAPLPCPTIQAVTAALEVQG